jgi:3-oxoacyl-[acyl-carrier protein] reductase
MIDLTGRKALITGGSRGIGRATSILFAKAGSDVAVNYLSNDAAAEEVRREIGHLGKKCLLLKTDISREDEVSRMVGAMVRELGGVDILVNNAGIWTYGEVGNMTPEIWGESMKANLDSVFFVTNAVVPYMKKQNQGWIINVSSTAAIRGEALHSHYAATKGALNSLTKSWAVELAPFNIRVNVVAPGWVDTDMCAEVFSDPQFKESVRQSIPLKRIPPPEDIAGPILFLASDLSRHITGAIINVNGGSVLCG